MMKVTEAEKMRVRREVQPKEFKVIEWKGSIREEWYVSEDYRVNGLHYHCRTYRSNWGRRFTTGGIDHD